MQATAGRFLSHPMGSFKFALFLLVLSAGSLLIDGCAATGTKNTGPTDVPLLEKWSGDYPVSELGRLPAGQQDTAAGYIGDSETFLSVWRVLMPTEILPAVDFSNSIVVFTRNTQFYNRTSIFKVTVQDNTAEILAMETMSAIPIEDKVAMALAVIPREGIKTIKTGAVEIKIKPSQ